MTTITLPDATDKQWEVLLLLISSEEKKIDRTSENEVDTMRYFLKNEGIGRIMTQWLHEMNDTYDRKIHSTDTARKCDEVSVIWRQRGNEHFRNDRLEDCYKCYNMSVIYAPQDGPMYPLAVANRSAALLKLKRFEDSMSDVTLALAHGYPKEQHHKLLLRRADCYIELGQPALAREAITAATNHAAALRLSSGHAHDFAKHIKLLHQKLAVDRKVYQREEDILPGCYKGLNGNFPSASKAIKIRRSDIAGRHVVVMEPTQRGDVMFSEEPYAFVTLPHERPVCDGCCRTRINIIPCTDCSRSFYCSVECRQSAAKSFHQWECVGARFNLYPTVGIAHLALRILLVTASEGFPRVPEKGARPTCATGLFASYANVDNIEIYKAHSPPFYRMFNLVTNFDKMNNTDYIQYALTATMLTIYLEKYTTFFEYLPSRIPYILSAKQLRLFAGAVILRSLGQLVCNGHATLSLIIDDGKGCTVTEHEVRRATAIYPSAAMMNHSCEPNIVNCFRNKRLIVRCSRELSPGAELLNCYGPHRARESTPHRRAQLKAQYMFNCNCEACLDTERGDFVLLFTAYVCTSCKSPILRAARTDHCPQCNAEFNLQKVMAIIDKADELFAQALRATTIEERFEKAHAALRMKQQVYHRHHTSIRFASDQLSRMYSDVGDFNKSMDLIKQNVQSLEYQYGSFSVEVAHEVRKLSEVMLERIMRCPDSPEYGDWLVDSLKIIKKAVQLLDLNYGPWETLVKRLREQENFVATMIANNEIENVHRNFHYNLKI